MSNNINLTAGMRSNLSSLQNLNKALQTTQTRLSTGKKVNSALDNPAIFYQASALNQRVSALDRLLDAMGQSMMSIQTANAGIEAGLKTLEQMKQTAQQAASLELLPETRPVAETAINVVAEPVALRSTPVATAAEVEATTTPTTQMVFEVGSAHDGKGNTAALVEQFGDGAIAASWCNQFYAPGVSRLDENFGQGEWYLPAVGEVIDAFSDGDIKCWVPRLAENPFSFSKFDIDNKIWVSCEKDEFDTLNGNYYYKKSGNNYEVITKDQYDQFIADHGRTSARVGGVYTTVYNGVRAENGNDNNKRVLEADEYWQDDDAYMLKTYNENTGEESYTYLSSTEAQNLIVEWSADENYYGDDYYGKNNIYYQIYSTHSSSGEKLVSREEYEAAGYIMYMGDNKFQLSQEDYQTLVDEYGCNDSGSGYYMLNNTRIYFGYLYDDVRYVVEPSENYAAIFDSLQTISEAFTQDTWTSDQDGSGGVWSIWHDWYYDDDEHEILRLETVNVRHEMWDGCDENGEWITRSVLPFTLLENKFNDAEVKPEVGQIMYSDLSCSSAEDYQANLEAGKTAVGVVAWVSEDGASARVMGRNLCASDYGDGYQFDPSNPYFNWDCIDCRGYTVFYAADQWREDIAGIANITDLNEAYFNGDQAAKTTVFDGKANTSALIEQYGDGAVAASACHAFYVPGVASDDANFGQGTWYLPAIGEIIQANGDYQISSYNQEVVAYSKKVYNYYQFALEQFYVEDEDDWNYGQWVENRDVKITAEKYEQLEDYYVKAVYNFDTGEETFQKITKQEYDDFMAQYGHYIEGDNSATYVKPGKYVLPIDWEYSEATADEYCAISDNNYYIYTCIEPHNWAPDAGYTYGKQVSQEEYEAFIAQYGVEYDDENAAIYTYVAQDYSVEEITPREITAGKYAEIKDDYCYLQKGTQLQKITKQEYEELYVLHGKNRWKEDGWYCQLVGCKVDAQFTDNSIYEVIDGALSTLNDKGVEADTLFNGSWNRYSSSTEAYNSHMYTLHDGVCDVEDDITSGDYSNYSTRAFNLIENQFANDTTGPSVGDVMYADLTYGSADDYDGTKTAVGVVVWVSENGASAKIMSLKDLRVSSNGYSQPDEFDPKNPYTAGDSAINFDYDYLANRSARNSDIGVIAGSDLISVYTASNPGSMVEAPIEPEPEPEPEPTPATQPSAMDAMQQQFVKINNEFNAIIADSVYNGIGLLKGQNMTVKLNEKAQDNMVIKGFAAADYAIDTDWQSQADIQATIAQIERTMAALQAYAQELSNAEQMMQIRQNFNDAMRDILQVGADNLVLADMNEETANYLAMQTRQQLAINALALAAQSDQSILKLFN